MRLRAIISIFVVFLLKGSFCYGQHRTVEFPDSNAKFTYLLHNRFNGEKAYPVIFTHLGDTMDTIGGKYSKLQRYGNPLFYTYVYFLVLDSSRVIRIEYIDGYNDAELWYDFNQKVGEGDPEILEIDTIVNQGITRRRMRLNDDRHYVLEGIGSTKEFTSHYFYNGLYSWLELLCFHVGDSLVYQNEKYNTCDTSWNIGFNNVADILQDQVTIYPNPTNNSVQIDFTDELSGEIEMSISDCSGKVVQREMLKSSSNSITLNLQAGVYFVSLVSEKYLVRRKLIVE
ncbi:MAG: T9SS type A sorting domain-containing protein [Bacteroidetes bacterium]|nr:T9SS type A sorting domain-containing protein [Bacteroidota bacterium]